MQDMFDDGFGVRPDTPGPLHQPRCTPALNSLVGRGHVGIHRCMPATKGAANMAGDATPAMKQFDCRLGGTGIHFLPGEAIGHGVVTVSYTHLTLQTSDLV